MMIRLRPKDPAAYSGRGLAWSAKGELDKAIEDFGEASRLAPKARSPTPIALGAWLKKGDYDKAIEDYSSWCISTSELITR